MEIFNYFGNILGYVLGFLYMIVRNYGVAILLFTIVFKAALFPLSIKQQRSMASSGKIAEKQKLLAEKYKNDKEKYRGRGAEAVCPRGHVFWKRLLDHPDPVPDYDGSVLYGHQSIVQCDAHRVGIHCPGNQLFGDDSRS